MNAPRPLRVGVVSQIQAEDLFALRRAAYRQAPEFDWLSEHSLRWGPADDEATVLGLWDGDGRLLSTLRATVAVSREAAEAFLEYSLQGLALEVSPQQPTLLFSRAATWPELARRGLFVLMRQAYLQAVLDTPLASLCAVVYEGGPRLRAMRQAGYRMSVPAAGWDSEARALAQPLVAVLPRAHFEQALATVTAELQARASGAAPVHADVAGIAAALRRCAARAAAAATVA